MCKLTMSIRKYLGAVWYRSLNTFFQFLNNIIRISTHFFTHMYFQKNTNNVTRTTLPNGPLVTKVSKLSSLRYQT